jgi:uncharacterized membrane protein
MTVPTDPAPVQEPVPTPGVTGDDRLWVVLCFLLTPIFPLITLFMDDKKARPFIKYHTIPTLIFGVVEGIIITVLQFVPIVNCIIPFIWIINVIYALKANKGANVDIPVITKFAQDQNWM